MWTCDSVEGTKVVFMLLAASLDWLTRVCMKREPILLRKDIHGRCQSSFAPHFDAIFKVETRMLFLGMECWARNSRTDASVFCPFINLWIKMCKSVQIWLKRENYALKSMKICTWEAFWKKKLFFICFKLICFYVLIY
jgi:hypothetical protein